MSLSSHAPVNRMATLSFFSSLSLFFVLLAAARVGMAEDVSNIQVRNTLTYIPKDFFSRVYFYPLKVPTTDVVIVVAHADADLTVVPSTLTLAKNEQNEVHMDVWGWKTTYADELHVTFNTTSTDPDFSAFEISCGYHIIDSCGVYQYNTTCDESGAPKDGDVSYVGATFTRPTSNMAANISFVFYDVEGYNVYWHADENCPSTTSANQLKDADNEPPYDVVEANHYFNPIASGEKDLQQIFALKRTGDVSKCIYEVAAYDAGQITSGKASDLECKQAMGPTTCSHILPGWEIAVIVIAVIIFLVIVAIIVYAVYRHRRR